VHTQTVLPSAVWPPEFAPDASTNATRGHEHPNAAGVRVLRVRCPFHVETVIDGRSTTRPCDGRFHRKHDALRARLDAMHAAGVGRVEIDVSGPGANLA
jgi:hypothetical protein